MPLHFLLRGFGLIVATACHGLLLALLPAGELLLVEATLHWADSGVEYVTSCNAWPSALPLHSADSLGNGCFDLQC